MAAVLLTASTVWAAPKEAWQAGVSFYTESGDYGTDSKATTTYIPFSLRRYFDLGDLTLTIPFISVTSEGQVVVVSGTPNRRDRSSVTTSTANAKVTHSGLGDMILKGRYYLLEDHGAIPAVDAIAHVKFPTASRADGLGTGEFDEGIGLEFTKTVAQRYLAMADVGYTFIGSPPDESYYNQWHYSFGPGYYIIPGKLLGSVAYEEYAALVDGEPNPIDLLFSAQYFPTRHVRLDAGVQAGLSRSAADYGINVGIHFKFQSFHLPEGILNT